MLSRSCYFLLLAFVCKVSAKIGTDHLLASGNVKCGDGVAQSPFKFSVALFSVGTFKTTLCAKADADDSDGSFYLECDDFHMFNAHPRLQILHGCGGNCRRYVKNYEGFVNENLTLVMSETSGDASSECHQPNAATVIPSTKVVNTVSTVV
ncbi:unnamed protein product [Bursaphelenchus xylophilus]|uniref:(pine wood nematode) hypothetical protein n=1 Tax=Bursaphelenchus xylophilus TaxID=6326 RepID=A0A1I7RVS7_BURXY|nr:unnamed protein product [Bursaphelenchus xylophilus]CAG9082122.1 unnamed protein product [Bursaphelenchus xylophilus]